MRSIETKNHQPEREMPVHARGYFKWFLLAGISLAIVAAVPSELSPVPVFTMVAGYLVYNGKRE